MAVARGNIQVTFSRWNSLKGKCCSVWDGTSHVQQCLCPQFYLWYLDCQQVKCTNTDIELYTRITNIQSVEKQET